MAPTSSARALEALRAAGLLLEEGRDAAPGRMEAARVARLLRERGVPSVGLVPADDEVAVPAIAVLIGDALARVSGRSIGLVDAAGDWPGAGDLHAASSDGSPLATSWLRDGLALLGPRAFHPGSALAPLRGGVSLVPGTFEHLVVDLTGFDRLGELATAMALLDGALLVARSGRTTHGQVRRWLGQCPGGRGLGVLLTGT